MKKFIIGFCSAIALIACIAATVNQQGLLFRGIYGGEPLIAGDSPFQSVAWLDFRSNGVPVFQLPANGILQTQYGGTGGTNFSLNGQGLNFIGTTNGYFQLNVNNLSNGTNASSDLVVTADNGTQTNGYANFGINSSTYQGNGSGTIGSTNDWYIFGWPTINPYGGAGWIGNFPSNRPVIFFSGTTNAVAWFNQNGWISVAPFTNLSYVTIPTNTATFSSVANPLVSGLNYTTNPQRGVMSVTCVCTNTANGWLTNFTTHDVVFVGSITANGTNYEQAILYTNPSDHVGLTNVTGTIGIVNSVWKGL